MITLKINAFVSIGMGLVVEGQPIQSSTIINILYKKKAPQIGAFCSFRYQCKFATAKS